MLMIDYYAHTNGLVRVHPAEKASLAAVMAVFCLASSSPFTHLTVLAVSSWLTVVKGRVPLSFYVRMLCLPGAFLAAGLAAVAFSVAADPQGFLWSWPLGRCFWGISAVGARTALLLFGKCLGAVAALYFLAVTTPGQEILLLLRRAGVPPLILEIAGLTYRYLFVLGRTAQEIHRSQSSRLGYASIASSFFSASQLAGALFGKSLAQAQALYHALLARGYDEDLSVMGEEMQGRRSVDWKKPVGLAVFLAATSALPALRVELILQSVFGGGVLRW